MSDRQDSVIQGHYKWAQYWYNIASEHLREAGRWYTPMLDVLAGGRKYELGLAAQAARLGRECELDADSLRRLDLELEFDQLILRVSIDEFLRKCQE